MFSLVKLLIYSYNFVIFKYNQIKEKEMKKKINLMKKSSLIVNVKSNGLKTSNTNIDSTQQTVNPLGNNYNKNITVPSFTNHENLHNLLIDHLSSY